MASMTMLYGMTSMASMNNTHHQMSSMGEHDMSNMSDCQQETTASMNCSTNTTEDCCAQECDCLTSGCSTVSAFFTGINYSAEIAISSKITSNNFLVSSQALTSLYRPPILS